MATKKQSLKGKSADELLTLVEKKQEELRGLRFSAAGSKNRNVKLTRTLRKEVARALTEVTAQSLDSARDKKN
jgi:ribosomal protein L29